MSDLVMESALAQRPTPTDLVIDMREIAGRGMIDLRGLASDKTFMAAAKSVLGVDLPKTPRTSAAWGDIKVLWLSPDQWLLLTSGQKAGDLVQQLRTALEGIHSLVVDVSDMRAVIRLEGAAVKTVLLKGSSLDLLGPDYEPGTVRRLRFAEIAALMDVVEETIIDLYVFRSQANYVWDFLLTSARKPAAVRLFGAQSV